MSKTQCILCIHEKVCRYIERYCVLEEEAYNLLSEDDKAIFADNIICKHYDENLNITMKLGDAE